ncbi:MAG TPA: hypothetical protein VMI73_28470 [Trebonia sp.]|nr:hypothetical protein [Trebonia sp.]
MTDNSPAVRVRGLVKSYGGLEARGLDLEIRAGEIFALLGPNGAGNPVTELRHSFPLERDWCAASMTTSRSVTGLAASPGPWQVRSRRSIL